MIYILLSQDWLQSGEVSSLRWGYREDGIWQYGEGLPPPEYLNVEDQILILPCEWVVCLGVEFPGKNRQQFAQAVPFLIEDRLASEIEDMHLAWSNDSSNQMDSVIAINREHLHLVITKLSEWGIFPIAAYVDAQLLPQNGDNAVCLLERKRVLIKHNHNLLATGYDSMALALRSLTSKNQTAVDCYLVEPDLEKNVSALAYINILDRAVGDPVHWLMRQSAENLGAVNLLTGVFQHKAEKKSGKRAGKLFGIIILILFIIQTSFLYGMGWFFRMQADEYFQQSVAIYRQIFTSENQVIAPRMQAEGHLKNSPLRKRTDFTVSYQKIVKAWEHVGGQDTVLSAMRLQGNILDLDIISLSVAWVEMFIQGFANQGIEAKLMSATQQENKTIARVRVVL